MEERLNAQSQAAKAKEAAAALKAEEEQQAAKSAKKQADSLREELVMQSQAQKDLHSELQALSSAAAAVRAVAKAKDQTITELQAAHRKMATEMAMQRVSAGSPSKGVHKVGEKPDP